MNKDSTNQKILTAVTMKSAVLGLWAVLSYGHGHCWLTAMDTAALWLWTLLSYGYGHCCLMAMNSAVLWLAINMQFQRDPLPALSLFQRQNSELLSFFYPLSKYTFQKRDSLICSHPGVMRRGDTY